MKNLVLFLMIVLWGCGSNNEVTAKVVTFSEATQYEYSSNAYQACRLEFHKYQNICFTTAHPSEKYSNAELYRRFSAILREINDGGSREAIYRAFCTKGFLLSCELNDLISQAGLQRDEALLYQILIVLDDPKRKEIVEDVGDVMPKRRLTDMSEAEFVIHISQIIQQLKETENKWRTRW